MLIIILNTLISIISSLTINRLRLTLMIIHHKAIILKLIQVLTARSIITSITRISLITNETLHAGRGNALRRIARRQSTRTRRHAPW